MDLVRQMERERQRKSNQNRRELLLAFRSEQDSMQEAEGSIHLSLDPPLEHPDRLGSMLTFDHDPQNAGLSTGLAVNEDVDEPDLGKDDQAQLDSQELELASEDSEPIGGQKGDLDVLRSLFVMAGETMATETVLTSEFSD